MEEYKLSELMDYGIMQRLQDTLSDLIRMGMVITDPDGTHITKMSRFTDFCKMTVNTPLGKARCLECNDQSVKRTLETNQICFSACHAGLLEYSAPVIVDGKSIGCCVGGQIQSGKPDRKKIEKLAEELGIEFEPYWEAYNAIEHRSQEDIEAAVNFIIELATVTGSLAKARIGMMKKQEEVEHAANVKTDFLANMSHEIRTPMNAVIGMAEMALREDLPDTARDYIVQIKNSGRNLLNIINDILDFSKVESGKMDIVEAEYEPLSMFNDIANIVMTRIKDKDVELLLKVNPNLPCKLYGDSQRIRQVLINLANNAVKFTNRGRVFIDVDFDKIGSDHIDMKIRVKDSGIGIKKEDLNKLFESFSQVDSKRNRSIEGTGLGLAISQRLVELLGGQIGVESEYEVGSTFYFNVPQKIIDSGASLRVNDAEKMFVLGYFRNRYIARQFYRDCAALSLFASALVDVSKFEAMLSAYEKEREGKDFFFFIEEELYDDRIRAILERYPSIKSIRLTDFSSNMKPERENQFMIRKPYSTVCLERILNNEEYHVSRIEEGAFEFDFIAPDAEVLIVDDNPVNLTVAEGLLEPLKMKTFSAISGKMAIDQIEHKRFDLIFMDHMMPELDGVETTRIIRRMFPAYKNVPIIALTANAVSGIQEMFLAEGMNDFVPKPIEIRTLVAKVKQWLPPEKIVKNSEQQIEEMMRDLVYDAGLSEEPEENLEIGDLDTNTAIGMLGSRKLYMKVLEDYYKVIETKSELIKNLESAGDIVNYTIEVHALKSLSKQVGAMELSQMAADLEKAGNANQILFIKNHTGKMLKKYLEYKDILAELFEKREVPGALKPGISADRLTEVLDQLKEACENLDMDEMERLYGILDLYSYPDEQKVAMNELADAIANVDVESVMELIYIWKGII